ncbi:hypothetical protein M2102_000306 [Fusobacterium sp. PH5-7]|uniref:helicase HerA domain-containing protein n=1 Tax=Fusobacterium sp. PH5-7 TaxID=2940528 RepID=UPI002476741C|nr:DUF87 domain-containing protein [Fusobacterium sp. PH5-7]MDH6456693.1 hypothetical protein [Fusobacterium sp. PH5-7]
MLSTKQFDKDELLSLIQSENFAGWVYSIDYEKALIITNDKWKSAVKGIPHNSFLLAASFDPKNYGAADEIDKEVVLLRVIGTCKLPQDEDMIKTKIDNYQNKTGVYSAENDEFDKITRNKLQFGGLECRVLGTFYMKNNQLNLGSDIETFSASLQTRVYVPTKESLGKIVNFVDPIRKNKSQEDFRALGIDGDVKLFPIGTVRYTSTDRMHRATDQEKVPFCIQPADFLARRTAVLGMTRTGKSNMIKQTVSVVKKISSENNLKIGQLIFDINGEYANANNQDNGSISGIFKDDCVKYRMIFTDGFKSLLNNFYEEIQDGLFTIQSLIKERGEKAIDIDTFSNMSLEKPDGQSRGDLKRWAVKVALYKTLLHRAGYTFKGTFNVKFEANKKIKEAVDAALLAEDETQVALNPANGFDFITSEKWFLAARSVNKEMPLKSSSGGDWLDSECVAMLNLLAMKNANDSYIKGHRTVSIARDYHSPQRSSEVCNEIYKSLIDGKIVILDLSVGNALLRERISKKIAAHIFNSSMEVFTKGKIPSNIVIYIEEAHNLIGKGMDLTQTWPRLAKEGAKYKIALVYATQEVSSVHKNILANTENWFVSHLNSDIEIRELAHFYDFSDFSKSLLRSQDVGFTRVKTLSSPYVVPVQIDKFDPTSFVHKGEVHE